LPTDFHIDTSEELISITVDADTTIEEFQQTVNTLTQASHYCAQWPHLVDLRAMKIEFANPSDTRTIEELSVEYRSRVNGNVAVVIAADIDPLTCANIFHFTCSVEAAELFDDYALAIKWLIKSELRRGLQALGGEPESSSNKPHDYPEQIGT